MHARPVCMGVCLPASLAVRVRARVRVRACVAAWVTRFGDKRRVGSVRNGLPRGALHVLAL